MTKHRRHRYALAIAIAVATLAPQSARAESRLEPCKPDDALAGVIQKADAIVEVEVLRSDSTAKPIIDKSGKHERTRMQRSYDGEYKVVKVFKGKVPDKTIKKNIFCSAVAPGSPNDCRALPGPKGASAVVFLSAGKRAGSWGFLHPVTLDSACPTIGDVKKTLSDNAVLVKRFRELAPAGGASPSQIGAPLIPKLKRPRGPLKPMKPQAAPLPPVSEAPAPSSSQSCSISVAPKRNGGFLTLLAAAGIALWRRKVVCSGELS